MSFSGSWNDVANTPAGTLCAHARICPSYRPSAAPRKSPRGGFHETKDRTPASLSFAAADDRKWFGSAVSKLRRMVRGPISSSASRNSGSLPPSVRPGALTAAPTARHRSA